MRNWRAWFSVSLTVFSLTCLALLSTPVMGDSEDVVPHWVRRAQVGRPRVYRNLALYPVSGPARQLPDRLTLDAALRRDTLHVHEVNEGGSVNQLTVENRGGQPIFIMAGEILSGAKQDRVLQHDLWLPAHSGDVQVAVYCVEHGRWTYKGPSKDFDSKSTMSNTAVRAAARLEQTQGAVWKSVDETHRGGGVHAPTQSLNSAYADPKMAEAVRDCAHYFATMVEDNPTMNGVVVQVGNRFTTIDLLPDRALLMSLWPKLTRSYALEARSGAYSSHRGGEISTDREKAQIFLENGESLHCRKVPNVGDGDLVVLSSGRLGGEALLLDDGPAHIELFSKSRMSQPYPEPRPRPTVSPSPWPPAQELIRPHRT